MIASEWQYTRAIKRITTQSSGASLDWKDMKCLRCSGIWIINVIPASTGLMKSSWSISAAFMGNRFWQNVPEIVQVKVQVCNMPGCSFQCTTDTHVETMGKLLGSQQPDSPLLVFNSLWSSVHSILGEPLGMSLQHYLTSQCFWWQMRNWT